MVSKIFQAYIISVLCFGLALGEFDENKRYSCYKCDSKTENSDEMVGDCWTLDGDYEITKEECHGCIVRNIEEYNSDGEITYEVERECLKHPWDQEVGSTVVLYRFSYLQSAVIFSCNVAKLTGKLILGTGKRRELRLRCR